MSNQNLEPMLFISFIYLVFLGGDNEMNSSCLNIDATPKKTNNNKIKTLNVKQYLLKSLKLVTSLYSSASHDHHHRQN